MRLRLTPQQVQRLILAPFMQQAISILILPVLELASAVEQELQNNPLLEIDEEKLNEQSLPPLKPIIEHTNTISEIDEFQGMTHSGNSFSDAPDTEPQLTREISLEDILLEQLRWEISDPLMQNIGELIISNLDEDGYLRLPLADLQQTANISDLTLLESTLKCIQTFEPIGIAARDLKECLILQIKTLYPQYYDIACRLIENHLEDLANKKHLTIAKKLGVSNPEVETIAKIISSLEPKPARNYRPISSSIYIKPDVIISKAGDNGYHISISKEGIPPIRVNTTYKQMLKSPNLSLDEKNYLNEKLKNATQFMRGIQQRGQTIHKITQFLLERQKSFFDGQQFSIVPMSLKDVAAAIGRNESTISRAISNKYLDTPVGTFPMKFFFSQVVNQANAQNISSRGVKEEIKELVDSEDKTSPLSDQEIQKHFKYKGTHLARRTVSKYRKVLKILPSHLRKNRFSAHYSNKFQTN